MELRYSAALLQDALTLQSLRRALSKPDEFRARLALMVAGGRRAVGTQAYVPLRAISFRKDTMVLSTANICVCGWEDARRLPQTLKGADGICLFARQRTRAKDGS